jgi:excisionase family DNA binding protein
MASLPEDNHLIDAPSRCPSRPVVVQDHFSPGQTAVKAGCSRSTVYRALRSDQLASRTCGSRRMISQAAIDTWLALGDHDSYADSVAR